MSAKPPPLTPEEQAARQERLQAEHKAYVASIATMRSLTRLQSTIAGAGGKTNALARVAEEKEFERQERLREAAATAAAKAAAVASHAAKVDKLACAQAKNRSKRMAKKARQKNRAQSDALGASLAVDDGVDKDRPPRESDDEASEGEGSIDKSSAVDDGVDRDTKRARTES